MGALFYRGAGPTELEAMTWERMRYWHGWHRVLAHEEGKGA